MALEQAKWVEDDPKAEEEEISTLDAEVWTQRRI
jgi:hypothetical protein